MRFLVACLVLSASFCRSEEVVSVATPAPNAPAKPDKKEADLNDERFHEALKAAANGYQAYGRVDHQSRWAPTDCDSFPTNHTPLISSSTDEATHGGKLYYLFAYDAPAYLKNRERAVKPALAPIKYGDVAAAQAIVKEAWHAKEIDKATADKAQNGTVAHRNNKYYATGEKNALFVMLQFEEKTAGTDKGWVYGTLSPDGKTVTSSGKVQSCMSCHENAGAGRLFGLKKSQDLVKWEETKLTKSDGK